MNDKEQKKLIDRNGVREAIGKYDGTQKLSEDEIRDAAAEKVALEWSQQMLIKAGEVTKTERRVRADRVSVSAGAPAPALEDENPYAALS